MLRRWSTFAGFFDPGGVETAAGAQAQGAGRPSRRRGLRYGVQAPLDVTVLRSGIPDSVPGRSLNLGSGGVAAVLAAEVLPGEVVGVEILLPRALVPLRARARVRHHDKLHCGMEFVGLSAEQKAAIRRWTEQTKAELSTGVRERLAAETEKSSTSGSWGGPLPPVRMRRRGGEFFFLVLAAILFDVV